MNQSDFKEPLSLIILRGLPGSGKTELAKLLSENGKYPCLSIDDFFTDSLTGKYNFDFAQNHLAYKYCEERTEEEMGIKCLKIFLHNTFTLDWEIEPYFKLAAKYDYKVFVVTVENWHGNKNQHGVSDEQLQKMALKYKVKLFF